MVEKLVTRRFTSLSPGTNSAGGLFTQLANIGLDEQKRVRAIQNYWNFYEGNQWKKRDDDNFTMNYCRKLLDTSNDFFTKNGFTVSIPENPFDPQDDPEEKDFVKSTLDLFWGLNDRETWLDELAQMGSVTGDAFVRVGWDTQTAPIPYPRANIIPTHYVFPIFSDIDSRIMIKCHIIWPVIEDKANPRMDSRFPTNASVKAQKVHWRRETWTKTSVKVFKNDTLLSEEPNVLGVIPIVHIKNKVNSNTNYGISDVEDLIDPQKALNEVYTDINDIIEYHGSPITQIKGGFLENIERGPDKVWSTPEDVDILNIEMKGDLKANNEHLEHIYRALLDLSGVPEQAINPSKNVSNTPGVALHMSFLPLIEVRRKKEQMYGRGIEKINSLMLQFAEIADPAFSAKMAPFGPGGRLTKVDFGEALPRDEILELEKQQTKLEMGLTTRKRILMDNGVGEKDADRIIEEANQEKKDLIELQALEPAVAGKTDAVFGKRRRPDPVAQGDKVSAQARK